MTATTPIPLADIYLRLSSEEAGRGESTSITNQRLIIRQYCDTHNIGIVREFIDDGYSGATFKRPGFASMMAHLASGGVNMVITKDLSRLGRDMMESSYYAERVFPDMGVRYIAIGDSFDSEETNLMAPFQFAMNDVYLRDTSRKIRQVLQSKRQRGEYCAAPPFGYMKNPLDKTRLVPNPDTAPIVQRIFRMAVAGATCHKIATVLTDECVVTPSRYKASVSQTYTDRGLAQVVDHWCHTTVKRILRNEVYLGKTQLGKTKKPSLKSNRKVTVPKDAWYQFDDTHQALVTQQDFDTAQRLLCVHAKNWRDGDGVRHSVFNGVAFCAHCGSAMCSAGTTYKGERFRYWFLYCNAPTRSGQRECEHRARIRYHDLVHIVTAELRRLLAMTNDERHAIVTEACRRTRAANVYTDQRTPADIEAKIASLQRAMSRLYTDNASGLIDETTFVSMLKTLSADLQTAETALREITKVRDTQDAVKGRYDKFFDLLDRYTNIDTLTQEIVHAFIDRIEVSEAILPDGYSVRTHHSIPVQQTIKIYYKFIGNMPMNAEHAQR